MRVLYIVLVAIGLFGCVVEEEPPTVVVHPQVIVRPEEMGGEEQDKEEPMPEENNEEVVVPMQPEEMGGEEQDKEEPMPEENNEEVVVPMQPEENEEQRDPAMDPVDGRTVNEQYAIEFLAPNDIVMVQNSPEDHGIHVRDPAGLHLGEKNIIGHMLNGATGTIVDGPEIVGDLIWFKIEWHAVGLGRCEINGMVPCVGWSAAVSPNDTRLLLLIK